MVKAVTAWRWDHPQVSFGAALAKEREKAETMLAGEVDSLPAYMTSSVVLTTEVHEGMPAKVLIAASHGADLLVLGSHGHSQALHRVLGSVSEDCVRNADCPVVVLPIRSGEPASAPTCVVVAPADGPG
jgi:nucleotide-binding universal stress UspA family protein